MYPNCNPLGLVGIIQEGNKRCPDDTSKGGYITFDFREPAPFLKMLSILDVDDGTTPEITVTYSSGQTYTHSTVATGNNGFLEVPFNTAVIQNVTRVQILYGGSGSINSLKYPYCPQIPIPQVAIKKFAGPSTSSCSQAGIALMEDNLYTIASTSESWMYCYEVSVPSTSQECLYDVVMNDPAPMGELAPQEISQQQIQPCVPATRSTSPEASRLAL